MSDYFDFSANPKTAWITVNRACNFRCKWCYGQTTSFNPKNQMSLDMAKRSVLVAKDCGVESINIIGGEPTIWQDLWKLISFCKEQNVNVGLITNAYQFSDDQFWEIYQNNPCDYVGLSVKSGNPKGFLDCTGVDVYDQTMIGLHRALTFHKCGVSTVYNRLVGKEGLIEIAKNCRDIGADSITISLCSAILDNGDITDEFSVELDRLIAEIMEIYPIVDKLYNGKMVIELFLPLCLFPNDFIQLLFDKRQISSICHVHDREGIVFDTNGDVLPCNTMIGNPIVKSGDYEDGKSLIRLLNSDAMKKDYQELLRYPSIECSSCKLNRRCKGGCILNWTILDPQKCKSIK